MRNVRIAPNLPESALEYVATGGLMCNFADKTSGNRIQLFSSLFDSAVLPIDGEVPLVDSNMSQELLTNSSVIDVLSDCSSVKVHNKMSVHDRTVYLYETNEDGIIRLMDVLNETVNDGYAVSSYTHLSELVIGELYDISDMNFVRSAPTSYDSHSDTVGYGYNVLTSVTTCFNNALDSVSISRQMADKFTIIKSKSIVINLRDSEIIGDIPELYSFIDRSILFKIPSTASAVGMLADNSILTSTDYSNDTILIPKNSFITAINVFCNNPIANTKLEALRLEQLDFNRKIYEGINELKANPNLKMDDAVEDLHDFSSYTTYRKGSDLMITPYIQIKLSYLSPMGLGTKITNLSGGKVTVEHIYENGAHVDEYGNTIDIMYPSSSLISRAVAGPLYEVTLGGISYRIEQLMKTTGIEKNLLFKTVKEIFCILNQEQEFYKWVGSGTIEDNVNFITEFLTHNRLPYSLYPFSSGITVGTSDSMMNRLEASVNANIGYGKLDIINNDVDNGFVIPNKHEVGYTFFIRLKHDPDYNSSGVSNIELNKKGYPKEGDSDKRDSRAVVNTKGSKISVMQTDKLLKTLTNVDADILLNGANSGSSASYHSIHEMLTVCGCNLLLGADDE